MRILVIDTDRELVDSLVKILKKIYTVDAVFSGKDGVYLATLNTYNVIILALDFEDMDGVEVCRMIRSGNVTTPILILTKRDGVNNKVYSLDNGADDYLTKPFSVEELLARIRALNRRCPAILNNQIKVGCLVMDLERQIVKRGKRLIKLHRKEFEILRYLMVHKGYTISKETLLNKLWSYENCVTLNTVEVHICELRDKINKGFEEDLIKTIRCFGYKLKG